MGVVVLYCFLMILTTLVPITPGLCYVVLISTVLYCFCGVPGCWEVQLAVLPLWHAGPTNCPNDRQTDQTTNRFSVTPQVPLLVLTTHSKGAHLSKQEGAPLRALACVDSHAHTMMNYLCTQVRAQGLGHRVVGCGSRAQGLGCRV